VKYYLAIISQGKPSPFSFEKAGISIRAVSQRRRGERGA